MKLLIVTQRVDKNDLILGFFHRWLQEFGNQVEGVEVIAQQVGQYELPDNVKVHSLGKEADLSTFKQIFNFWRLQRRLSKDYDRVLVHMTPIWIVLGAPLWLLRRKPMYLWYESRGKRWPLRAALLLVRKIFSASEHGLIIPSRKSIITGHGIDTDYFAPCQEPFEPGTIVTVGRLTRAKHLDDLLNAFANLPEECRLIIAGRPMTPADKDYEQQLKKIAAQHHIEDRLEFVQVTQAQLPSLLHRAELFVHLSKTSLDKSVLEAMAAGCPVISTASAVQTWLDESLRANYDNLPVIIKRALVMSPADRERISKTQRERIVEHHSLKQLIARLTQEINLT